VFNWDWGEKMFVAGVRKRHFLVFVLLVVGSVLSLVGVALFRGEQHVEAEWFRLVFYVSVLGSVVFAVFLAIGMVYLRKWRKRE